LTRRDGCRLMIKCQAPSRLELTPNEPQQLTAITSTLFDSHRNIRYCIVFIPHYAIFL